MGDEYFGRTEEDDNEPALRVGSLHGTAQHDDSAHLTLAAIEQLTGINYVSLQRYAQAFGDRLPHEGTGRNRRYYPSAVKEFQRIKAEIAERRAGSRAGESIEERAVSTSVKPARRRGKAVKDKSRKSLSPKNPRKKSQRQPRQPRQPRQAAPLAAQVMTAYQAVVPLDRLAKVYQLRLQLKTLDEVIVSVTNQRTKVEAEIAELENPK